MKVILIQDVENLGKQGDIKEVAKGYARNFLLPKKIAKLATKKAIEELEKDKELETKKAEKELKNIQELVSKVDGQEIEIQVKTKDAGKIYGSITPFKISQILKNKGFDVKKNQIKLSDPIKKIGGYPIIINFDHGLEAEIKLIIVEEKLKKL